MNRVQRERAKQVYRLVAKQAAEVSRASIALDVKFAGAFVALFPKAAS